MKDELPDIFSKSDNADLSLEELMAADAADSAAEDKQLNKTRKKSSAKKIVLISTAGTIAAGLVVGALVFNPFGGSWNFNDGDRNKVSSEKVEPTAIPTLEVNPEDLVKSDEDFAKENRFPIKVDDWQKERHSDQDISGMLPEILGSLSDTNLASSANTLPSESTGFTSDQSQIELEDGTPNPLYSFWTAESFTSEVGTYTERLLNPVFGGWELYQYAFTPANTFLDIELFSDMFVDDWRNNNTETPYSEYVPVFADWGANDYGMGDVLLASGSRWFGEVVTSNTEFVYDMEAQQYRATMVADVKFTAWSKDQQRLEKTGTLTLTLVPNVDGNLNSSGHKVLIESGSLKVDG